MSEIQSHEDRINKKNSKKNGLPEINYVKLVRVYFKSEDYAEIETEYMKSNEGNCRLSLYCLKYFGVSIKS